jgi:hypothetical protein
MTVIDGVEVGECQELVVATVIATLRYAAEWLNDDDRNLLSETADQVAAEDPREALCCPVCEEVECDEGCPLAGVRRAVA